MVPVSRPAAPTETRFTTGDDAAAIEARESSPPLRARQLRGRGSAVGDLIVDAPSIPTEVRRRETFYRRALVAADIAASAAALLLVAELLADRSLRIDALLGIPLLVMLSRAHGLYERDHLVLRK